MKVHPTPKKRNITTTQYDAASPTYTPRAKKLKRLPHVFARVLELPFHSGTDVLVQETPDCFRFVANNENITTPNDYQAYVVEIFPGVTKIMVRQTDSGDHDFSVEVTASGHSTSGDGEYKVYWRAVGCYGSKGL